MVIRAWSNPVLRQGGGLFDLPDHAAIAKPLQRPHPPLWMSVKDASEWTLAGKLGLGAVVSAPPDTALRSRIDAHRHAVGGSTPDAEFNRQIAVSTLAMYSATAGSAAGTYQFARWPRPRSRPSDGAITPPASRRVPPNEADQPVGGHHPSRDADGLAAIGLLIGDAQRCIEVAKAYAKVGVNRLLCHFPARSATHLATTDAITRFGNDVVAAFA